MKFQTLHYQKQTRIERNSVLGKVGDLPLMQVASEVTQTSLLTLGLPPPSHASLNKLFNVLICSSRKSN